jgi:hypothetical protein
VAVSTSDHLPQTIADDELAEEAGDLPAAKDNSDFPVYSRSAGILKAIIRLTDEIPTELVVLNAQEYSELVCALESLSSAVTEWHQRGGDEPPARIKNKSPIAIIRHGLSKCPDESPAPGTVELAFINDLALGDSIRTDISAANRDAANGEWKGATVLAGSATEALLLWSIQDSERKTPGSAARAISGLRAAGGLTQEPNTNNPERWNFVTLIEVAHQLKTVRDETAKLVRLSKDFRNLIHPGRATRLGLVCDRGTALSALAAIELVVRDLGP